MKEFIKIPAGKKSVARRKSLYGAGINDADYMVCPKVDGKNSWCLYYRAWQGMIARCYSQKLQEKYPTYIGCSVVKEWLTFSNFRGWMEAQDWEGKQLDKDILISGNKVYGPDTCIFVSGKINSLLADSSASRGNYPQGVCFNKAMNKYQANCSVSGKKRHLGFFATINAAEFAYLNFKSDLIKETANDTEAESNPKLKAALLRHSEILTINANNAPRG